MILDPVILSCLQFAPARVLDANRGLFAAELAFEPGATQRAARCRKQPFERVDEHRRNARFRAQEIFSQALSGRGARV
ncbi:MAG: hypothetical protein ACREYE_21075 [Gammaproteobacteria bacterium]